VQEEIINLIAASLGGYYGVIYRDVIDACRAHGDCNAFSAIVWFDQFLKKLDRETFDKATVSLEEAVKKDPEYALAWAVLSEIYSMGVMMGYRRLGDQTETAISMANKAVKLDPSSQHAYQALACAYFLTRDKMKVISACDKCIALNTRAVTFSARIGIFLIYAGEYERGVKILRESLELNPFSPLPSVAFSLYHFQRSEFLESWNWAEKADMPLIPWFSLIKAASMAQLGKFDHAKREIEILLITKPDITVLGRTYISSFVLDEELVDNIIASLEKIGLVIETKTSRILN
jgi:tetratricopeptide (TPR) repeat protein